MFTFNSPSYITRLTKLLWRTIIYRIAPTRCLQCGSPVDGTYLSYKHKNAHSCEVMLASTQARMCKLCLFDHINHTFDNNEIQMGECQSCMKHVPCEPNLLKYGGEFVFGTLWWNGWRVCRTCLLGAALFGERSSSLFMTINKHHCAINHRGASINTSPTQIFSELVRAIKQKLRGTS